MGLRLVKLFPEQVARHWQMLCPMIESTLPPIVNNSYDRMERVFESILAGNLDVLQFFDLADDRSVEVKAFAVVAPINNIDGTGRQLLVYSLYGYGNVGKRDIADGLKLLAEYARGQSCDTITAYTNLRGLAAYFERMGGSSSYTFLRLEV